MKLSEYVNRYMEENGCSQRELARRCGLSAQTISNIVNEKGGVDTATYAKLATGMNSPMWKLMAINGVAYIDVPSEDQQEDLTDVLESLRARPELRMLFESSKNMSPDQVRAIVQMIEGFRK